MAPAPARAKIEVAGVSKIFNGKDGSFTALAGIDLHVDDGEFLSLIGPSGCGKSTLLEILAGLQRATTGEVRVDGNAVTGPGPDRAVVFQNYALFPWRTVSDNVSYALEMKGVKKAERRERARHFLALVGLERVEHHYVWQLSGGMRQRVGLARALACEPSVLLMDEPFGALDAITRDVLQDHLLSIQSSARKTVVFVTHSVDEAIYLSDRIMVMGRGPGRFVAEFRVDLDRSGGREPMRADARYGALHAGLWHVLAQEMGSDASGGADPDSTSLSKSGGGR
jgi:NitT/TauT family transport system ATP-binding protein